MKTTAQNVTRAFLAVSGLLCLWLGLPGVARPGEPALLTRIENEIADILEDNRSGVVRIHTILSHQREDASAQFGLRFTHGTGFVFDPAGYVLTVDEAVRGADRITVTLASGQKVPATFIASDPASEVAVVRVEADSLPVVRLGDSGRVRTGHYGFILGNTYGNLTPSFGVVQELNRDQDLIQLAAPVYPSHGGAPVFSTTGEVAGMVWAAPDPLAALRRASGQDQAARIFMGWQEIPTTVFVIPINRAVRIARRLVSERQFVYGWLGVEGEYEPDGGFRVTDITPDGPAASNGIRPGDLIVGYQGMEIVPGEDLRRLVLSTPPGTSASLQVIRAGAKLAARVEVGEMSSEALSRSSAAGRFAPFAPNPARRPGPSNEALFKRMEQLEQDLWRLQQQLGTGVRQKVAQEE
ncbi:MAG: trypsin-like peptidase domain-containing protein [Candidatus Latescibacteria bacterium]|jgi:S1-C subfamily serine protease|nr:trypsin-like peptidase domain-containing protein [Candidatus Latescibacterota bacterium]